MKIYRLLLLSSTMLFFLHGKAQHIERAEPLNWWTCMNTPLQVMFHGQNIGGAEVKIDGEGMEITGVHTADSPNYLFVDLDVKEPGDYTFEFKLGKKSFTYPYNISVRREGSRYRDSFSSKDFVYLVMPDRFANGDPSNDGTDDTVEKPDRSNYHGRHGGDIRGIIDHLDYIASLGATALWSTPLTLDNDSRGSYHGYGTADYYMIDPRFGTNELYREMVAEAHRHGIKIIMDVVTNHCGISHWWMDDLPFADWINRFPDYRGTSHAMSLPMSNNASQYDTDRFYRGWFVPSMPDMNLKNPYVLQYFRQWAVWWIEQMDIDGLRVDTYPYNDKYAMAEWVRSVLDEYPDISIVGESWHPFTPQVAYWIGGQLNYDGFDSHLPMGMDFPLMNAINKVLSGEKDQSTGATAIYDLVAQDFVYRDPNRLMIFLENHDTDHLADIADGNPEKVKIGMTLMATMRGMPQMWTGTELMFRSLDRSVGHGAARIDFPGGWPGDGRNLFTEADRTDEEQSVFDYVSRLFNWRKGKEVIHTGRTVQFYDRDGSYIFFRCNDDQAVMVVVNISDRPKIVEWEKYGEIVGGVASGYDIVSDESVSTATGYEVRPYGTAVIEFALK
ncbi:MAG: cyclomaltodextrinase N-terminal domain-containing protein [Alistipes sp.]|nr:cyclomaltodextrinase N-terminal domain-containing protein [Alistipes sp.]